MEYEALDDFLFSQGFVSSFGEMAQKLQNGTQDSFFDLLEFAGELFFLNLQDIKSHLLQLMGICLFFSIIHQLSKAYGKDEIEKYGNYIYFVCGATICLNLFMGGYETVFKTVSSVLQFMEVLLPTYTMALFFSNGSNTSGAYYGMVLLAIFLVEWVVSVLFLPGTKIYMAIRFVNEGVGENFFSKFQKLFEDVFSWGLKGMLLLICSINTLQALIFPTLDKVRRLSAGKTVSAIPWIGNLAGSTTEILLSTGAILKNSIGVTAILVLIALCAPGIIKLVALVVGIRVLEACLEPILGQKSGGLLEGCYKSVQMLLKIQINTLAVFSLCLVILTAFS